MNERRYIKLLPLILSLFFTVSTLHSTIIEDPDQGNLSDINLELEGKSTEISESISFELGEESIEYTGEQSVVEYESPFKEPIKEGDVRFWVDPEIGWIEYQIPEDTVVLKSQGEVEYSDIHLLAEEVEYNTSNKIVYAEGEASIADSEGLIEGDKLSYDFDTKKGLVYYGESKIDKGFYEADRLKKIGENEYCAKMGIFTTCEYHHKHYYFWSPNVKIYQNDKIIAKPVVMFIHDFPIIALPYYIMDLKKERHSGFLFPQIRYIGGNYSYFIINNGYYWAINNDCDLTFYLDYNSRKGWGQKVNYIYTYGSDINLNSAYFSHYRDRITKKEWWKIYTSHRQDFGERTNLRLRLDYRSDTTFDKYFDESFETRTKKDLSSFLTFTRNTDFMNISVEASRTKLLYEEDTLANDKIDNSGISGSTKDTLPRITFSGMKAELGDSDFYLSWSGKAENKYSDGELSSRMAQIDGNLSYPFKIFRYLRVQPTVNGRGQWHYIDDEGNHNRFFGTYSVSTSINTKIYGIFKPGERELRHIISPHITHSYSPGYDDSWKISGGGIKSESHSIHFGLGNTFVLIPPRDSDSESVKFIDFSQSISYDFLKDEEKFSNLRTSITFTPNFSPVYYVISRLSLNHNVYDWYLSSLSLQTSFSLNTEGLSEDEEDDTETEEENDTDEYLEEDPYREDSYGGRVLGIGKSFKKGLQLQIDHTYSKSHGSSGYQSLNGTVSYAITKNWRLSYTTYYNITTGEFSRQTFSIYRDLHCWEARVSVNYSRGAVEYWFEVRIKDIPEIRIHGEQRRTL
jgi:lipopolysaccharide assembly outer membrane protein LptD (OstA)